jgi:hypothetical protein
VEQAKSEELWYFTAGSLCTVRQRNHVLRLDKWRKHTLFCDIVFDFLIRLFLCSLSFEDVVAEDFLFKLNIANDVRTPEVR